MIVQLDEEKAKRHMHTQIVGSSLEVLEVCESTSTVLKGQFWRLASNGSVLAARQQTSGRGRGTHTFYSPKGGLYFSFALFNATSANESLLTIVACVSVYEAVLHCCGIDCAIKWVNDIYVEGKKVCGILSEKIEGGFVIGIGLNVYRCGGGYPPEAGVLSDYVQSDLDINLLFAQILNRLEHNLFSAAKEEVLNIYKSRSMLIGKRIVFSFSGENQEGVAIGINANGELLVQTNFETIALLSGEVSLLSSSEA
ncbi:MAG: biotin--[acetyl-CoA-carboxylase] ligase [Eubacteriaceae bacterium]|jgi:BirA family biotin operon repressor/biotin-[acetyl-CoA-carboxylase] ligase|nr:biotin--[acetyl-CoA-carboxylase] ligase [Eubacteriaceae bacterium]